MPANTVEVEIRDLQKTYPNGSKAIRGVSLKLEPSKVFGLIGPNGAGKSTLMKLTSGLLRPEYGQVLCNGHNVTGSPASAARYIGLMPDPLGVYTDITAAEYLEFFARLFQIPPADRRSRINSAVDLLELGPWLSHEVETLSAGWQRRLALGRLLLPDTPVLLLDEPAAGLDLMARKELLSLVRRLAQTGHTIMVSSHIISELEDLADTFGVLIAGGWKEAIPSKLFFAREDLKKILGKVTWRLRTSLPNMARAVLGELKLDFSEKDAVFSIRVGEQQRPADVLKQLVLRDVEIDEFAQEAATLSEFVSSVLGGKSV